MRTLFMAFIFAVICFNAAIAGAADDCNQFQDLARTIRGCSQIIDGRASGQKQAAYHNRGVAYDNKGEHDRAIADYTRSMELDPSNAIAYSNRCGAYVKKWEYDRAITDCNRAMELNSSNAIAYSNRCGAYVEMGEYDRA